MVMDVDCGEMVGWGTKRVAVKRGTDHPHSDQIDN